MTPFAAGDLMLAAKTNACSIEEAARLYFGLGERLSLAQLQAAATQQSTTALSHIEHSARLSQTNSKAANERVQAIDAGLKQGRQSVANLIEGVTTTLADTRGSLDTISRLEAVARRIEKIVDTIALVAVQTSMLAVSGSVEAARAGESGRGFAVVSNDIRTLSREATVNVDRAKDSVRGILDQIVVLKTYLQQIAVTADLEVQNNQLVVASLENMEKEVTALGVASQSILDGATGVLSVSTEMGRASAQIASAAEQAGAAARQAAAAATEQTRAAEDLAAAIEEIASLADTLNQQSV